MVQKFNPDARWDLIPEHMREGVDLWISRGVKPGSFLRAVLENNLWKAIGKADVINARCLPQIISFFYNEAPSPCWGSPEKVKAWAARGGLLGHDPEAA